jgi:hypothetical protein
MKNRLSESRIESNYSRNLLSFISASLLLGAVNFSSANLVQAANQKQNDCCENCEKQQTASKANEKLIAANRSRSGSITAAKPAPIAVTKPTAKPSQEKTLAEQRDEKVTIKSNTKQIELVGEVVDTWCYSSGVMGEGRGEKHRKCGRLCVGGGVTAGILTDDGTLYIAAKHQGYNGCAGLLLPYVADRVKVSGWLAERGGVKLLKIIKVERVKTAAKANTKRP